MALTLVVETGAGLTTANSYATIAEAATYMDAQLTVNRAVWTAAGATKQAEALVMATRLLDDHVAWKGYKQDENQALEWPRTGVADRNGFVIDSDTVPARLKNATAELAWQLLVEDRTAEDDLKGFARLKVGPIDLAPDKADVRPVVPAVAAAMIADYGSVAGHRAGVKLVRA